MKSKLWVVGLSLSLVIAGHAYAGWKQVCGEDIKKYCSSITAPLDLTTCLKESTTSLSHECRSNLNELTRLMGTAETSCQNDLTKFCATTMPGKGNWISCLHGNENTISNPCKNALASLSKEGL